MKIFLIKRMILVLMYLNMIIIMLKRLYCNNFDKKDDDDDDDHDDHDDYDDDDDDDHDDYDDDDHHHE